MVFQRQVLKMKRGAFIQLKVAEITDTLTQKKVAVCDFFVYVSWQKEISFIFMKIGQH